jgi:hypothetical protein
MISQEADRVISAAIRLTQVGFEIPEAARIALAERSRSALRCLAERFVIEEVRKVQRAKALEVEQRAQRPKRGTRAYAKWVETTEEGQGYEQDLQEIDARANRQLVDGINRAIEQYATELKMQWTAELLDSTFALGDGTQVRWGEATIEQHQARRDLFVGNAQANMEGAARHEMAIDQLTKARVATLRELVGEQTAA